MHVLLRPLLIRPAQSQSPPQFCEPPAQGVLGDPPERSTSDISVPRPDDISCRKPHGSLVSVACAHGITSWTGLRSAERFLPAQRAGLPFVLVKRPREELAAHQEQLLNYSFREGVKLSILTNGFTWWFYLPLNEGSWEERRFFTADFFERIPKQFQNASWSCYQRAYCFWHSSKER